MLLLKVCYSFSLCWVHVLPKIRFRGAGKEKMALEAVNELTRNPLMPSATTF